MTDPQYGQPPAYGQGQVYGQDQTYAQGQQYAPASGQGGTAYSGTGQGGMQFPAQGATSTKGFMASLFDTSFSSFVTPKVINVVYVIIMIILGISTLGYIIFGFVALHALGIIFIPIALLIGLVYLAVTRMLFELIMVIFRMGDDMHILRSNYR